MSYKVNITNGAAHTALAILQKGLTSIDDIYVGGRLSLKLKKAKQVPKSEQSESIADYEDRVQAWLDKDYEEIEVPEDERDCLKTAMKSIEEKKAFPEGMFREYVVELIKLLGLSNK